MKTTCMAGATGLLRNCFKRRNRVNPPLTHQRKHWASFEKVNPPGTGSSAYCTTAQARQPAFAAAAAGCPGRADRLARFADRLALAGNRGCPGPDWLSARVV